MFNFWIRRIRGLIALLLAIVIKILIIVPQIFLSPCLRESLHLFFLILICLLILISEIIGVAELKIPICCIHGRFQ